MALSLNVLKFRENLKNMLAGAVSALIRKANPPEIQTQEIETSVTGHRRDSVNNPLLRALDIFGMSTDYLTAVMDCKRLSEENPIFAGIMDKVVGPVAECESYVKVDKVNGNENDERRKKIEDMLNRLIADVKWNEYKDENLRHLLNEGGLTMEVIADSSGIIRGLEYRPHYSIEPLFERERLRDPEMAYRQVDVLTRETLATFAKWQIAEVNWKESSFHDRGIPYLMAARKMLSSVGDMINGSVQKWIRSGGEIEMFSLKNATSWEDVERFKELNKDDLTPNSRALVRQVFSIGDFDVKRLHGDSVEGDSAMIEFLLELIFMSTGVSKEIMGFKGNVVIRDMASISLDSYYRLLSRVQNKAHQVLKRACDIQLLTQYNKFEVLPEQVEYQIVGGSFVSENTQLKIDTTVKVVELLQKLLMHVQNKEVVLEQIVGILQYDLKEYGLSFKEKLKVNESDSEGNQ